jgi:signal peptidase I
MGKRGRSRHTGRDAGERGPEPESVPAWGAGPEDDDSDWNGEPEHRWEPVPDAVPGARHGDGAAGEGRVDGSRAWHGDGGAGEGRMDGPRGVPEQDAEDAEDTEGAEGDEFDYNFGRGRAERRRAARRIKRRRRRSAAREVPILIGIALVIALFLKTFLVQAFVIPSGSMEDTINVGDRVLVDKLTPWFGAEPHRGDVIVFQDPGHWLDGEPKPAPPPEGMRQLDDFFSFIGLLPSADDQDLIKRVIAVGGDEVRCCDEQGRIMVNGKALDEPYVAPGNPPSQIRFDIKVPPGRLWVMGDHRSDSADSRYHMNDPGGGTIPENLVVGKAFVIAWPVSHWRRLQEPGTFASVPAPSRAAAVQQTPNNRQDLIQLPTPAELPLVMGVVGLYRVRRRLSSRSEEWKWGTLWSAHGPDPASRKGAARRPRRSALSRSRPR